MNASLASYAVQQGDALLESRVHPQPPHAFRSPFQRDRDRVLHARSFRRLAGKTQVFTRRFSDHLRSRLTHTMEVAQIARTAGAALHLNEDLIETLALVHDIGHPPFGHAGEQALDEALAPHGLTFDHNLHALRIVEHFEQRYPAFRGLNLTLAVREGIIKHSRNYSAATHPELAAYFLEQQPPLEAQLIDLADEIAYTTADLDDGVESGLLRVEDVLHEIEPVRTAYERAAEANPGVWDRLLFNEALRSFLNVLVEDLVSNTMSDLRLHEVLSLEEVRNASKRLVTLSPAAAASRATARAFLFRNLYDCPELADEKRLARATLLGLFQYWMDAPEKLPRHALQQAETEGLPRTIADYIAGMTDAYAYHRWQVVQGE